jgi:hypothetical protein
MKKRLMGDVHRNYAQLKVKLSLSTLEDLLRNNPANSVICGLLQALVYEGGIWIMFSA